MDQFTSNDLEFSVSMETTGNFASQTIKEEPSSPVAIGKTEIGDGELPYEVKIKEASEVKEVTTPSKTDALGFSRDIKTEELDIPITSDYDENLDYECFEPTPLPIKTESNFIQGPQKEDDSRCVMLIDPHAKPREDFHFSFFIETSGTTYNTINLPRKIHNNGLLKKCFAKSYVLLGRRVDHNSSNIKINQKNRTSNFQDECSSINAGGSQKSKTAMANKGHRQNSQGIKSKLTQWPNQPNVKSSLQHGEGEGCKDFNIYDNNNTFNKSEILMFDDNHRGKISKTLTNKQSNDSKNSIEFFADKSNKKHEHKNITTVNNFNCKNDPKELDQAGNLSINTRIPTIKHIKAKTVFSCKRCKKAFPRKYELKLHLCVHTCNKKYSCKHCLKSFSSKYYLRLHSRTHSGKSAYSCEQCMKCFKQKNDLIRHLRTHSGEKTYSCDHCMRSFSKQSILNQHLLIHPGGKPFSCDQCIKSFSRKNDLSRHLRTHIGQRPYSCKHCQKSFSHKTTLIHHIRTHTGERPYSCDYCHKSFSQKAHLIHHVRTHTGEKPYSCEHCHKSFSRNSNLIQHIRTHTGKKPYSCDYCHKSFLRNTHLILHLKTHTGEKPYSCDQCIKSFSRKIYLSRHLRSHNGERPYSCDYCNKSFSQKTNLIQHIRTHTGQRPYSCKDCHKSFSRNSHLIQHIRTHTGEKPYSCDYCRKSFSQNTHLIQHIRTHIS